mgnify:CR=1 FL=1
MVEITGVYKITVMMEVLINVKAAAVLRLTNGERVSCLPWRSQHVSSSLDHEGETYQLNDVFYYCDFHDVQGTEGAIVTGVMLRDIEAVIVSDDGVMGIAREIAER